jgi:hypothetical protein
MHGITEKELYVPWALGIICRHDPCVRGGHLFYLLLGFKKKNIQEIRACVLEQDTIPSSIPEATLIGQDRTMILVTVKFFQDEFNQE